MTTEIQLQFTETNHHLTRTIELYGCVGKKHGAGKKAGMCGKETWDWEEGSVAKDACCSPKGPRVLFTAPMLGANSAPGDLTLSSGFCRHQHIWAHAYT